MFLFSCLLRADSSAFHSSLFPYDHPRRPAACPRRRRPSCPRRGVFQALDIGSPHRLRHSPLAQGHGGLVPRRAEYGPGDLLPLDSRHEVTRRPPPALEFSWSIPTFTPLHWCMSCSTPASEKGGNSSFCCCCRQLPSCRPHTPLPCARSHRRGEQSDRCLPGRETI